MENTPPLESRKTALITETTETMLNELLTAILPLLGNSISITLGIAIALTVATRLIPNEKLYGWGFGIGQVLGAVGVLKAGKNWEKIENFLINSFGQLFSGIKDGLNSDDENQPSEKVEPNNI